MSVRFCVYLGDEILDEEAAGARAAEVRAQASLKVAVVLGDTTTITDAVEPLRAQLLDAAPRALEAGDAYAMRYGLHPGEVRFTPDGAEVAVDGDYVRPGRFDRAALAAGLRACAERLARLSS